MNPHIILPGLLAIVAASLTCSELLKQPSIIFTLTRAKEINYDEDLLTEKLKIMPIESLITPIDKNEMSQPHLLNHYKPVNILQDTTIAEAIAAFRTTHNNHLNVYLREDNDTGESHNNSKNNNDTNKTMLGIIKRQDLSNFIQQFEDS